MTLEFPGRQVITRTLRASPSMAGPAPALADATSVLQAMVLGIDARPRPLPREEIESFEDVFSAQLLLAGKNPMTLAELARDIEGLAGEQARPSRKLFVVAEGAALQPSHPAILVNTRLVFTWQKDNASAPDLLLSTVPDPDNPQALLQLISWSEGQGAFHFFERVDQQWMWAGNSFHALSVPSRGRGPFDSHINGGLVMKELKRPWVHWHSQSEGIPRSIVFPTPQLDTHPLFQRVSGAEVLESIIKAGVRRWTARRIATDLKDNQLDNVLGYARQLLWTTSVNLVSTETLFPELAHVAELELPAMFFYDKDGLHKALQKLDAGAETALPDGEITVSAELYARAAQHLHVHIEDFERGGISVAGDTHFAFLVPERAFEDLAVLTELMAREALSPRLTVCMLMVDYPNPVFSPHRAKLLRYFPQSVPVGSSGTALDQQVVDAIRASGAAPNSPEGQFLALWNDPALVQTVRSRLVRYADAVRRRLQTFDGVLDLLRLADSRREAFRGRDLNEFRHTTARNGAIVAHLAMTEDATLVDKQTDVGEKEL